MFPDGDLRTCGDSSLREIGQVFFGAEERELMGSAERGWRECCGGWGDPLAGASLHTLDSKDPAAVRVETGSPICDFFPTSSRIGPPRTLSAHSEW